jgi:hypothetical protein
MLYGCRQTAATESKHLQQRSSAAKHTQRSKSICVKGHAVLSMLQGSVVSARFDTAAQAASSLAASLHAPHCGK